MFLAGILAGIFILAALLTAFGILAEEEVAFCIGIVVLAIWLAGFGIYGAANYFQPYVQTVAEAPEQ